MAAHFRHFAINADDLPRARRFYETVFGWNFAPWGPPGYLQTSDAGLGVFGALQDRRTIGGRTMPGLEATFAVEDISATVAAIEAAGGKILMPPFHIQTVGRLVWFEDSEGNVQGAMQYDNPPG